MRHSIKQFSGFTMIELIIGMLLTTMFIGGIGQIFISTSKNFRTQKTLSYMMEDARYALDKVGIEIRRTGYLSNRLLVSSLTVFDGRIAVDINAGTGIYTIRADGDVTPGTLLTMTQGETIKGSVNAVAPASDNLLINYQIDDGTELTGNQYSPCTMGLGLDGGAGEVIADSHVISILFYIKTDATLGSNVLYCQAFRDNLDRVYTKASAAIPLISNIERLRILYGESDGLGAGATVYRNSAQVSDWLQVKTARISIVLHSDEQNISVNTPGNYNINGKLSIAPANPNNKQLYRVFSTTVALRNSPDILKDPIP